MHIPPSFNRDLSVDLFLELFRKFQYNFLDYIMSVKNIYASNETSQKFSLKSIDVIVEKDLSCLKFSILLMREQKSKVQL